jgi:hypothetical protein
MRIYDKRTPTTVPFKDIQPGECFIDMDDALNIKIDVSYYEETEEYRPNAVVLGDGQAWQCGDDEQVIKVRATVTIDQ